MPIYRKADAVPHQLHGAEFRAYASPSTGSPELCTWQVEIAGRTAGIPHRVGRTEVFILTGGRLSITVDGVADELSPGDVLVVPAGAEFRAGNRGTEPATAWVTTTAGFTATLPDGSTITPPWAS